MEPEQKGSLKRHKSLSTLVRAMRAGQELYRWTWPHCVERKIEEYAGYAKNDPDDARRISVFLTGFGDLALERGNYSEAEQAYLAAGTYNSVHAQRKLKTYKKEHPPLSRGNFHKDGHMYPWML